MQGLVPKLVSFLMRPVSRKPVGSGRHSPPPGDFVIPPVPSALFESDYMGYEANPYHAVSEPPPEREITTTSAPQPQWQEPYDTNHYNGSWNDTNEQFVYPEHNSPREPYNYSQSIISHHSQVTGDWDQSVTSVAQQPPPPPVESVAPLRIHTQEPLATAPVENQDQAALGIGTGSDYIKRRRKAAGIACSRTMPKVLPIGIKSTPVSKQYAAPPAFVRKAMNIRYAHLPQRMLASEIDDEDALPDSPIGRVSYESNPSPRIDNNQSLATVNTRSSLRRSTSSESVVEDIGKIKLFVANPDD